MPAKAKLVTRQATTSSVTSDNLNKGSALEFAELDSNLINLRDQTFGVVADDSSTIDIAAGGTLYIQGGTNVTTSTNSDGTITINSTGGGASALGNITGSGDTLSSSGSSINLDDPVTISTAGSTGTNIGNIARFNSGTTGVDFNQQGDLTGSFFIYGDKAQQAGHDKPFRVAFDQDNTVEINGYKMPEDDGTNGQIIKTDGSNTLSFITPFKVVGDDSAAVDIMAGGTLYIQGGTNVTTSTNSDGTITINATAGSGTITALNNQAENRLTTIGSTTTQLDGEANLTFDGSTLSLTGQADIDFVSIKDNKITTNATNADLQISANGTGQIQLSPNDASVDDVFSTNTRYDFGANRIYSEQNADANSIFSDSGDRRYANGDFVSVSLASSSSNSHARWRSGTFSLLDMKGFDIDSSTNYFKGIVTRYAETMIKNTSTSAASTLNNITGVYSSLNTEGTDSGGGLTISSGYGFVTDIALGEGTSETVAMTNAYHYAVKGSSGGGAITNEYGVFLDGISGTNKYGFYTNDQAYINLIGGVTLQSGNITHTGNITTTGNISSTGTIGNDAITLDDNHIKASRSNDTLHMDLNTNNHLILGEPTTVHSSNDRWKNGVSRTAEYSNFAVSGQNSSGERKYLHPTITKVSFDGSDSTSSHTRWRNAYDVLSVDLNGSEVQSGATRFAASASEFELQNSSGSATASLQAALGHYSNVYMFNNASNLTVTDAVGYVAQIFSESNSGKTLTTTNAYGFKYDGAFKDGSGTDTITNEYGFAVTGSPVGTNAFSFYDGVNGRNLFGDIMINQNTISTNSSNADLEINTSGTGKIKTSAALIGVGDQTGGNIILTDQADGSFQTAAFASPGMLNPSGLQIDSAGSFHYSQLILNNFSLDANNALWATRSRSNTHGTNAYLQQGDVIFQFFGAGWNGDTDGTGYFSGNAVVDLFASENHDASNRGGGINFQTINTGAASGATTKLEITDNVTVKNPKSGQVALSVEGDTSLDLITIADNKIDTNASNADLELGTNGTGTIQLSTTDTFANSEMTSIVQGFGSAINNMRGVQMLYKETDVPALTSSSDRRYIHGLLSDFKMNSSVNSSDSDNRFRNAVALMGFDVNGAELTNTGLSRGPRGLEGNVTITNSASDAATLGSALGLQSGVYLYLGSDSNGNVSNTKLVGNNSYVELGVRSGLTATVSQATAYQAEVYKDGLGGTETITDAFGFRCDTLEGTNKYAFFDATNSQSRFGLIELANQSGDPSGIGDASHIYAKDDGGSSEVHVRDEAGNVTKISPHNDAGEWEFYSKNTKTGKTVRINMEKMIKKLEDITGETFIESV